MLAVAGEPGAALLKVQHDRDEICNAYISAFEDPEERQEYTCNCCRAFIRQIGPVVALTPDCRVHRPWIENNLKRFTTIREEG